MEKKIHQIYDKVFKKILTLSEISVINLINGLFGTDYPTDSRKQMETVIFSIFRNQGLSIFTPHQVYRMNIR